MKWAAHNRWSPPTLFCYFQLALLNRKAMELQLEVVRCIKNQEQ